MKASEIIAAERRRRRLQAWVRFSFVADAVLFVLALASAFVPGGRPEIGLLIWIAISLVIIKARLLRGIL